MTSNLSVKTKKAIDWLFKPKVLLISGAIQLTVWSVLTPLALIFGFGSEVQYVTFISHFALILTALGLIQTALVDKKADERDPNTPTD